MTHVRETIEALSLVLKNVLDTAVSAEMFRQAKFDQPEATERMWETLSSLLGFYKSRKPRASQSLPGVDRSQVVSVCQHEMFKKGYRARDFFRLPGDMSRGSRDVLLALGWLLAKESVLQTFWCRIEPICTEDPPFDLLLSQNIPCSRVDFDAPTANPREPLEQRTLQLMQQLICINGKLSASLRMLLSARNEYAKLTSKMHAATCQPSVKPQVHSSQSTGSRHLSVLEIYLLRHPKQIAKYQAALEHQNSCIHSLIVWTEKEPVFWKWMESVLEIKLKGVLENSSLENQGDLPVSELEYKPSAALQKAKSHQVELSRIFQSQEHLYKRVSKTWKKMRTELGGAEGLEREKGDVFKSLDRDLVGQIEQLQTDTDVPDSRDIISSPVVCRHLKYTAKSTTKHHKNDSFNVSDAATEITRLSQEVCSLEKELNILQQRNKEKMLKFSENFEDIICIPPQVHKPKT